MNISSFGSSESPAATGVLAALHFRNLSTEFKGAMAENAVLQSLIPLMDNQKPYYWTSPGTAEVEFVVQWNEEIIRPVRAESIPRISRKTAKRSPLARPLVASILEALDLWSL